ncbi:hypothetical protein NFI96_034252 [Prochilodus magdalenae]|nr:hypothetical protein NFI96_034252 [Prochilodus magdalenae]
MQLISLQQVHPDTNIGSKEIGILNLFVNSNFNHVTAVCSWLAHYNKAPPSPPGTSRLLCVCLNWLSTLYDHLQKCC